MTAESNFIAALRGLAGNPAARGLLDDAAVLEIGGTQLVLTHDMIVEGVHFLSDDPAGDVAWKLVAVNLSDLAAKGARPAGLLLGYSLTTESDWDEAFMRGLGAALDHFGAPLLGGDTVSAPPGAPRALGLTAIGTAAGAVPSRSGTSAGDLLWVSGSIGDAGAGLRIAVGEIAGPDALVERYRRPSPRLEIGAALAARVSAMMDVSDGLLIDAARMADASMLALDLDLDQVPLSTDFVACLGGDRRSRIDAAVAGDDYELLFAAAEAATARIERISEAAGLPLRPIGRFRQGRGLRLFDGCEEVPLPPRLGWEHRSD